MAQHNELGKWGEDVAEEYLRLNAYRILYRDWKYGHRDLDIVAIDNDVLVIVEVKTRRNEMFQKAEETVSMQKMRSISIAANTLIKQERFDGDIRFDIITVIGTPDSGHEIRHIEDAFRPFI